MVLLRLFDKKAVALQRTGRLGTYAVSLGQEAVSVGIAAAMRKKTCCCPPIATMARCFGAVRQA
jgi:Pyruvate/2-oxoglutarate dehydrogenase complex, dehydrogenase (E1) component, eukaryotic type, alpha subunit